MPTLPDKNSLSVNLPNARRSIVGIPESGIGRAISRLGDEMYRVGGNIGQADDRTNYAKARLLIAKEQAEAEREYDANPDFEAAEKAYKDRLTKARDAAVSLVSPKDREVFGLDADVDLNKAFGRVEGISRTRRKDQRRAGLFETLDGLRDQALQTPDNEARTNLVSTGVLAIDGAIKTGDLTAQEAQEARQKFMRTTARDWIRMQSDEDQVRILSGGSDMGGYGSKVQRFESGGKADAVNPDTKAVGPYQFIDSTWLNQIAKHAPEAIQGKTREQILALRSDPAIAKRVFEGFTRENDGQLAAAALPVNDTTRYLAHWFGAGGAINILKADPNQPISAYLPAGKSPTGKTWAEANGIEGKTVGEVIALADQRMGGSKEIKVASADAKSLPSTGGGALSTPRSGADLLDPFDRQHLLEQAQARIQQKFNADRVERDAREVQTATDALFSRYGYSASGEAKALADIRAKSEGKRQNDLVTAYRGRAEESRRLERQADDDLFETAYDMIWAGKANEITPDMRARLEQKGHWDKLGKEIEAQQSGVQQSTNWLWYHENYGSKTPAERMKVPLATLKEYMGHADYKKVVEERKKLAEDDPGERDISKYISDRLKGIGIKGKNETELKKVDLFHKELEARAAEWQNKNGRKMPNQEKRKLVDELTGKLAIDRPGWFNIDIDTPLFTVTDPESKEAKRISKDTGIPPAQLPMVFRKASEYGIKPTIDNLRQIFEEGTQ